MPEGGRADGLDASPSGAAEPRHQATPGRPFAASSPQTLPRGSPGESLPAFSPSLAYSPEFESPSRAAFESPSPVASEHSDQELGDDSIFSDGIASALDARSPGAVHADEEQLLQNSSYASTGGYLQSTRNAIESSPARIPHGASASSHMNPLGRSPGIGGVNMAGSMDWEPPPEPDAGDEGAFVFEVQGVEPVPPPQDPREIHAKLLREARSPLEIAVLGKLRAWETGSDAYTIQDMMDVTRWLESKLMPPPPTPFWQRYMQGVSRSRQMLMICLVILCLVLACVIIGALTGAFIEAFKDIGVDSQGILTVPDGQDSHRLAGIGSAVSLHGLLDYPGLPVKELRQAQDVVFTHEGAFHFYRIASMQQTRGGGVRIAAQDGTRLLVEDGFVSFERPFTSKEVMSKDSPGAQGDSFATAGAFKTILPSAPES